MRNPKIDRRLWKLNPYKAASGSLRPVYPNMHHPKQTMGQADGCTHCATHCHISKMPSFTQKWVTLHLALRNRSVIHHNSANLACCLVSTHSFISFIFSICPVAAFRSYWHFEIRMSRVGARTQPIVGISIVCGLDLQSANIVRVNYNGLHATKDVRLLSSSAYVRRVHSTSLRAALYDFL